MTRLYPLLAILLITVAPRVATAQYVDRDDSARFEEEFDDEEFMIAGRFRAILIPGFALSWFLDEHENMWTKGQTNFSWGGEAIWRRANEYEIGVAVDYADLSMPDGWWLDRGEPVDEADWTMVDLKLLSVTFVSRWFWRPQPWLSPYLGVSVGPGFVLGEVLKRNPAPGSDCRAALEGGTFDPDECRDDGGDIDLDDFEAAEREDTIPPVLPVLGAVAGLRFNVADYVAIKVEAGFQDYFFLGTGLGVQW